MKKSYYKESLFYTDEHIYFPDLDDTIVHHLSKKNAVGVIGGYYDREDRFPICFISGFALDMLGMSYSDLMEKTDGRYLNLVWEADRRSVMKWFDREDGEYMYRLMNAQGQSMMIKAARTLTRDSSGRRVWLCAIRQYKDVISNYLDDLNVQYIGLIDVDTSIVTIEKNKALVLEEPYMHDMISYEAIVNDVVEKTKYYNYDIDTRRKLSLNHVIREMEKTGNYEHIIAQQMGHGEMAFIRRKYRYFDQEKRFIFMLQEDVTDIYIKDSVTDALNYDGFLAKANAEVNSSKRKYSILYVNICNFKAINDMYDYEFGNCVLQSFSQMLNQSFLHPYCVARTDSDHFLCLVDTEVLSDDRMKYIGQTELRVFGHKVMVRLQVGIYNIKSNELNKNMLVEKCRYARTAQQSISGNYMLTSAYYDANMTVAIIQSAEIINNLETAIRQKQFQVYYQPIFDAKTEKIVSAEALIRWNHPKHGLISPGNFIPELEKRGIVSKVDLYVAQETDRMIRRRLETHRFMVPVSMNLSKSDMKDRAMLEEISKVLHRREIDHRYYRLELTESAYISLTPEILHYLDTLRTQGVTLLVDDFGNGYSSFSSISEYPYDIIKLDMSFAMRIGESRKTEAIIHSIIEMCHRIDVKVIAEGVETKEQLEKLRAWDCDYIQGYYFSKPLSQEAFEYFLDHEQRSMPV